MPRAHSPPNPITKVVMKPVTLLTCALASVERLAPTLRPLVFMAALAPLAIAGTSGKPMWDDAFFLERAVCVNRAAFALSAHGVWRCIGNMSKSPIMALLLLPAGPLTAGDGQLGVATFMLASCTLALAALLGWMILRSGAPLSTVIAAGVAIAFCNPIRKAGAPFLVDGPFAILVAVTLLMPFLEMGVPNCPGWSAVRRGFLWGAVFGVGVLSKVTFCYFAVLTGPLVVIASLHRSGARATRDKLLAATAVGLIPLIIFIRLGPLYLSHGYQSALGEVAAQYGAERPFWRALADLISSTGGAYWFICASLLAAAVFMVRRAPERLAVAMATWCILLAYLFIVSLSRNEDPRFLWVVWVSLPVSAAAATAWGSKTPAEGKISSSLICAVIVLASAPMFSRFDFQKVREAEQLLRTLKSDRPARVEIASDPPFLNINTFQLARQIASNDLQNVEVSTVIYDEVTGRSAQFSLEKLRTADFTVFPAWSSTPAGPSFTNRHAKRFLEFARTCGRLIEIGHGISDTLAFDMREKKCRTSTVNQ